MIVRVPPALKRSLAREVARSGKSMNDIAVGILGTHFGVEVEESGRAGPGDVGTSGVVVLRMPDRLKDRLNAEARSLDSATNDLIVRTLSETLGVRSRKEEMAATNGKPRGDDGKVRVAIVGVGNCASALVQGVEYYKEAAGDNFVPGLMHVDLGGYHVADIEFTAAFDVTKDKVGKDLADATGRTPQHGEVLGLPEDGIECRAGDPTASQDERDRRNAPGERTTCRILRETPGDG